MNSEIEFTRDYQDTTVTYRAIPESEVPSNLIWEPNEFRRNQFHEEWYGGFSRSGACEGDPYAMLISLADGGKREYFKRVN